MLLKSFAIDSLEILDTNDFEIDSVAGLEEPDRRVTTTVNPGADGGFVPAALYGLRGVSITGAIAGNGPLGPGAARAALGAACQLQRTVQLLPVLRTFTFTLLDGRSFMFQGQVTSYKAPNLGVGLVSFSISIIAPDPLLYDPADQTSGSIAVPFGGGVILPTLVPFVRAASTGGHALLANHGNETTYPLLTLVGPLTSPYMLNQASGQYLQLAYTIPFGSSAVVDMKNNTIALASGLGLLETKVQGSSWWGLVPGDNPLSFSTGNSGDTGWLQIAWNNASISI
jgi:hypothetical protein